MKDSYFNKLKLKDHKKILLLIDKQEKVINKVIKHSLFYKEYFLNSILPQLDIQGYKNHIKKEVRLNLI
jgi:hypothetical protein